MKRRRIILIAGATMFFTVAAFGSNPLPDEMMFDKKRRQL